VSKTLEYTTVVTPPPKIRTSISFTTPPPASAIAGQSIAVDGKLVDEWGNGLAGKYVSLYIDGYSYSMKSTASTGYWSFSFYLSEGTHTIYAQFKGDAQYEGCSDNPTSSPMGLGPPVLIGVAALAIAGIAIGLRRLKGKR
jgi:hypothetical protein